MRRALAILKYVPAVLCGLLVVAWVVSIFVPREAGVYVAECDWRVVVANGTVGYHRSRDPFLGPGWDATYVRKHYGLHPRGFTWLRNEYDTDCVCPIAVMITATLPLAIAPFTRFRFPLWSYFAWTALVAAELAYYLK